jgi:hypothetical protein
MIILFVLGWIGTDMVLWNAIDFVIEHIWHFLYPTYVSEYFKLTSSEYIYVCLVKFNKFIGGLILIWFLRKLQFLYKLKKENTSNLKQELNYIDFRKSYICILIILLLLIGFSSPKVRVYISMFLTSSIILSQN